MNKEIICNLGSERITKETFKKIIKMVRLKVTDKYAFPPIIITCLGAIVATVGNFSATVGKPKSKKTFNISAIVAAAISGLEIMNYKVTLPPNKAKVLYIDTEQGRYHCSKVLERIMKLAGFPLDHDCDKLEFLCLREFTPEQRRDIINNVLQEDEQIGLVIIDGIRDLVRDINNSSEALEVMNDLMRWSSCYDLHIHTVLHLNKGDDNTRGHLGTELNNKSETVLQITKCREDGNMSEVRVMHIRDKEFQPFAFRINSNALPEAVPGYSSNFKRTAKITYEQFTLTQHREAIELAIGENKPLNYTQMLETLTKGYASYGYSRGRCTMVNVFKLLIEKGLIIKENKTYFYKSKTTQKDESDDEESENDEDFDEID